MPKAKSQKSLDKWTAENGAHRTVKNLRVKKGIYLKKLGNH